MTPTRSGSNYSIQSNGSGPGHSSHKSKRQKCQPRAEAQMEDARTSTSSHRLARNFDTLIESPEADITAIAVVRPESLSTANNRDIPVSVQELVYGGKAAIVETSPESLDRHHELLSSSEEVHGARKERGTSEGLETHVSQRTSPKDKTRLKNQSMLSEVQKKKLAQGKENSPVEAPQASKSKNMPQQVPKRPKKTPKTNHKGKAKPKWNTPYLQN
ncbi:hypothetical protein O181_099105 [Austropuccinia psidii MF-1]|uniref:Uncharacterized protein n=1 Tax=Austropuccinia psidii MF-1 TaxID=1389203 RepID=A0A9Q3JCY9_9BASI|nr:hypothetical protein [Austropuccinia psidii MF-1]